MSENIYERLINEKKHSYKGGLYHNTQIGFAYNSEKLEGSSLTPEQTRYLFETRSIKLDGEVLVPKNDITTMDNHFVMFNHMLDTALKPLSEEIIKEFHGILFSGTDESRELDFAVGDYKKISNTIGFFIETTEPEKVAEEMKKLIESYNSKNDISFEDVIDLHYAFERIHPFQNGNGRVGRMIMFRECLRNNIVPFVVTNDVKRFYTLGLDEYGKSPVRLRETCALCQDGYAKMCIKFGIDISNWQRSAKNRRDI